MARSVQPSVPLRVRRLVVNSPGAGPESLWLSMQIFFALAAHAGRAGVDFTDLDINETFHVDRSFTQLLPDSDYSIRPNSSDRAEEWSRQLGECDALLIATPVVGDGEPSVVNKWINHILCQSYTMKATLKNRQATIKDRWVYVAVSEDNHSQGGCPRQGRFLQEALNSALINIGFNQIRYFSVKSGVDSLEATKNAREAAYAEVRYFFSTLQC
ncbi:NAD(P)H-dependent oxidoreductase [Aquipseudomonas alcaligenes]|uniref:Flavodoxin-like fold n=1 Tax=Aquipseudomonas alcaligenes TaxID=43263 RepID=A0A1N6Q0T3_AQUAC|nr:NAD(P)H-dependent oxidoreductase [Pseudomonas alcaligenes]SIQ10191.1 Flavodoxin-like fold [Pseudomonas alcaligenes]